MLRWSEVETIEICRWSEVETIEKEIDKDRTVEGWGYLKIESGGDRTDGVSEDYKYE